MNQPACKILQTIFLSKCWPRRGLTKTRSRASVRQIRTSFVEPDGAGEALYGALLDATMTGCMAMANMGSTSSICHPYSYRIPSSVSEAQIDRPCSFFFRSFPRCARGLGSRWGGESRGHVRSDWSSPLRRRCPAARCTSNQMAGLARCQALLCSREIMRRQKGDDRPCQERLCSAALRENERLKGSSPPSSNQDEKMI